MPCTRCQGWWPGGRQRIYVNESKTNHDETKLKLMRKLQSGRHHFFSSKRAFRLHYCERFKCSFQRMICYFYKLFLASPPDWHISFVFFYSFPSWVTCSFAISRSSFSSPPIRTWCDFARTQRQPPTAVIRIASQWNIHVAGSGRNWVIIFIFIVLSLAERCVLRNSIYCADKYAFHSLDSRRNLAHAKCDICRGRKKSARNFSSCYVIY